MYRKQVLEQHNISEMKKTLHNLLLVRRFDDIEDTISSNLQIKAGNVIIEGIKDKLTIGFNPKDKSYFSQEFDFENVIDFLNQTFYSSPPFYVYCTKDDLKGSMAVDIIRNIVELCKLKKGGSDGSK
jgi:hypothetical protein